MLRASPHRLVYAYRFGQPSLKQSFGHSGFQRAQAPPTPATPSPLTSTTLSNGVRVVSHDLQGAHAVVGVYAEAGPKFDPVALPGLSHVMRCAIQTSNMDNSLFQIDRTMRATGFAYGHGEVAKRHLSWKAEGRRDLWEKPFEMLGTGVVAPRFHESDIERFRDTFDNQLDELRWQNPRDYVVDQLETVAFYKEPLGAPRMVPRLANDRCSSKALVEHWAAVMKPQHITIAAVNVPHEALVAAYEKLPYKHSAEAPHHARSPANNFSHANERAQFYEGRQEIVYEARASAMGTKPDMEAEVIAAFGVATNGRDESATKYAVSLIIREMMQRGVDASYITLQTNHFAPQVFYRPYSSTGLIGFTVCCAPHAMEEQVAKAVATFPASLDDSLLKASQHRALMRLLQNEVDLVRDYCDFIACSKFSVAELTAALQSVSKAEVEAELKQILAQKPSSFVTGDTFVFPKVAALNKA